MKALIFKTEDGGVSWEHSDTLHNSTYYAQFDFIRPDSAWISDQQTLFFAKNRLGDWDKEISASTISGKPEAQFIDLEFINEDTGWIIIQSSEKHSRYSIYYTADRGITWTPIAPEIVQNEVQLLIK